MVTEFITSPNTRTCIAVLLAVGCLAMISYVRFGGFFRSAPSVEEISTQQLHQLQSAQLEAESKARQNGQTPPTPAFILVDVRSPEEYGVSMIPGAITKQQYEQNQHAYQDRTVIPYCTIGVRSAEYAQQLAEQGINVLNFKDSIVGWCNQQLPLVTPQGEETRRVHTVSSRYRVPSSYQAVW